MGRPRIEHRVEYGVEVKRCCKCKEWLPLDQFGKGADRWDGLNSKCKRCSGQVSKAYRANNVDKVRAYDRKYAIENRARKSATRTAWRHRNPERDEATRRRYLERNPDRVRELDRARYPREREKRLLYNRRYYEADKDRGVAQVRQWRIDNPKLAAIAGIRHRARRRARLRDLPTEPWTEEQVIERDGFFCWINGCNLSERSQTGGRRDWAIDHLIPIAVNYVDHPGDTLPNLAIACHKCNIWKHNKILPAAVARYESNLGHRQEPGT